MARWLLAVPPLLLLVLAPAAFVMRVRLLDNNLHTVIPGELYRSAQLAPESLDREIERLGLRSIVNLRGDGKEHAWYQAESETVNRHGVALHDLDLSGQRLPSRQELSALLDQLEHVERPALMHCLNGTDRSGLAASLAVLLQGAPVERARDEFALRHGYPGGLLGSDVPAWLDQYEGWLVETGRPSTPARLRSFVAREYTSRPSSCRGCWSRAHPPASGCASRTGARSPGSSALLRTPVCTLACACSASRPTARLSTCVARRRRGSSSLESPSSFPPTCPRSSRAATH
jgi:protein tyrosine phosphatase (PTP) superfamily phosphohydrolase (DUF442 family)